MLKSSATKNTIQNNILADKQYSNANKVEESHDNNHITNPRIGEINKVDNNIPSGKLVSSNNLLKLKITLMR